MINSKYALTEDGKFRCPECPMTFERPQGVGRHLACIHNIPGTSRKKVHLPIILPKRRGRPPGSKNKTKAKKAVLFPTKKKESSNSNQNHHRQNQDQEQVLGSINYCPCCAFPIRGLLALQSIQNEAK